MPVFWRRGDLGRLVGKVKYDSWTQVHGRAVAVVAQQWNWIPRFIMDSQTLLKDLCDPNQPLVIYFSYLAQVDPEKTFETLLHEKQSAVGERKP